MKRPFLLIIFSVLIFSCYLHFQEQYGNIRSIVTDIEGDPLTGVVTTLEESAEYL